MALKASAQLPAPPADLAARSLPLKRVQGAVFRIHRTLHPALHFGTTASARFDDPLGQYGVLYAALQPEAAFAEVFLRQLSEMLIRELDLQERSLSQLRCRALKCVDLTGAGLRQVSCDNRLSTEKPYRTAAQWSRAFFEHPDQPEGLIYRSRHNPQFRCLVLFERCRARLSLESTEALMSGARRVWTLNQLAKYELALEPAV